MKRVRACVRRCVRACAALRFSAAGCTISRGCTSLARGSPRGFKRALSAVCRSALSRRGIVKTRRALDSKIMRDEVAHRSDRPIDRTTRVTKLSLMRRSIVKRGARFFSLSPHFGILFLIFPFRANEDQEVDTPPMSFSFSRDH